MIIIRALPVLDYTTAVNKSGFEIVQARPL
jgi:hypothetical protein